MTTRICRWLLAVAFLWLLFTLGVVRARDAGGGVLAQSPPTGETATVVNQSDDPLLKRFRFRSIGPAHMGGRLHQNDVRLAGNGDLERVAKTGNQHFIPMQRQTPHQSFRTSVGVNDQNLLHDLP